MPFLFDVDVHCAVCKKYMYTIRPEDERKTVICFDCRSKEQTTICKEKTVITEDGGEWKYFTELGWVKIEEETFKCCPYCHRCNIETQHRHDTIFNIVCKICNMRGPKGVTREDAIKAWNNLPRSGKE